MAQRLSTFLVLFCLLVSGSIFAETRKPSATGSAPAAKPHPLVAKSVEERFLDGLACLKQSDTACADVVLAGMPPASPYAKILDAQLAAARQDFDTALRLLIPLQADSGLLPQAKASLHATLAQAYEKQDNVLRALEQRNLSDPWLASDEEIEANHQKIWQLLAGQSREGLVEMRGESSDTLAQGWIDLALAAADPQQRNGSIAQWRSAYPDHPASAKLLQQLAEAAPAASLAAQMTGTVALLLPLEEPAYATAAKAIEAGLMAARGNGGAEVRVYPSRGDENEIAAIYQRAVAEGAQYVIGPLTREEVSALAAANLALVPTIALNTPDQNGNIPEQLSAFGQPVEPEAAQVALIARERGMQSAIVVAADMPFSKRMAQAFVAEWQAQQGAIAAQVTFNADTNLAELKAELAAHPADMIFLAANFEQARLVRPYLDQAIPTFATSHIYEGIARNQEDAPLSAVHFVDMPWMINPDRPDFTAYRTASAHLPPGEAQRWFALGVDAWRILAARAAGGEASFSGLTGSIQIRGNRLARELPLAQFRAGGVAPEQSR